MEKTEIKKKDYNCAIIYFSFYISIAMIIIFSLYLTKSIDSLFALLALFLAPKCSTGNCKEEIDSKDI